MTDEAALRRILTRPYPYVIFYKVTDAEIILHAVRHGAREPSDRVRPARVFAEARITVTMHQIAICRIV